jgi:hypothetical protein
MEGRKVLDYEYISLGALVYFFVRGNFTLVLLASFN